MNSVISKIFIFNGCDFNKLDKKYGISDSCKDLSFKKEEIIGYSEKSNGLPIILSGTVAVLTDSGNLIRYASSGEILGVASIYHSDGENNTVIKAASECRIMYFPTDLLTKLLKNEFVVTENYLRFLSDRVHFLNRKINILTQGNTEQKLAVFLYGFGSDEIVLPVSYIELAEYLSLGRASLYRALDDFCEKKIIQRNNKSIKILNRKELKSIFGGKTK